MHGAASPGVADYDDEVARAVPAGLREHGLRTAGDLAVVGVDDLAVAARPDSTVGHVIVRRSA